MRRRPRIDGNHRAVTEALEAVGASVQSLAAVGDGCPDLLVGRGGCIWLIEVKDGSKRASARQLTKDQRDWINWFNGEVHIVTSVDEALRVVLRESVHSRFMAGADVRDLAREHQVEPSTIECALRAAKEER